MSERLFARLPLWGVDLVLMAAVGLFFGLIGPFGTNDAPVSLRLPYWLTVMMLGGVVIGRTEDALARLDAVKRLGVFGEWAVLTFLATLPQTAVVSASERFYYHGPDDGDPFIIFLGGLYYLFIPVLIVVAAMVPLLRLARRALAGPQNAPETPAAPAAENLAPPAPSPDFLRKLPAELRREDILALQAEDHYVRVHTAAGSTLVLMRLSDAIAAMPEGSGFRLHRSWWAGREVIVKARYARGSGEAELNNGLTAPISRTHAPALREAGLL